MYRVRYHTHMNRPSNTANSGSGPNTANAWIKFVSNSLWADLLLSEPFNPYTGCQIRLLWFRNGTHQFSASIKNLNHALLFHFPLLATAGWRRELEAQNAKITGWGRNNLLGTWDKKINSNSKNINSISVQKRVTDVPKCSLQPRCPQQSPFFWTKIPFPQPWPFCEVLQNKPWVPAMPPQGTAKTNPILARTRTLGRRWAEKPDIAADCLCFGDHYSVQRTRPMLLSLGTAKRGHTAHSCALPDSTSPDTSLSAPALELLCLSVVEQGTFCIYPHYKRQQGRAQSGMDEECFPAGSARAHRWVIVLHFSALCCSLFRDGGMEFTISLNCHLVTQLHYSCAYLLVCSFFFHCFVSPTMYMY